MAMNIYLSTNNPANKKVTFEKCAPFTNCITRRINTQVDNAHDIDVVMLICNLIEYSDNYSKTSENLWLYQRDEPALAARNAITDFKVDNATTYLFKIK